MVINVNGDLYSAQLLNSRRINMLFPDGTTKELFRDNEGNWMFDINDGDFMLADILGRAWLKLYLKETARS